MNIVIFSSYAFICKVNNYGSLLQYFALQTFLEKHGHNVKWLKYSRPQAKGLNRYLRKKILKSRYLEREFVFHNKEEFNSFVVNKCHFTEEFNDYKSLRNAPPKADIYIIGSDQVWAGYHPDKYLQWTPSDKRRISYAASFGKDKVKSFMKPLIWFYLNKFNAISVREPEGVTIVDSCWHKYSKYVIDPTFLIDKEDYYQHENHSTPLEGDYIYGYFVNPFNADKFPYEDELKEMGNILQYKIYITAIQNAEYAFSNFNLVYPSPIGWIKNIDDSKYFITNSFHGIAFAINTNTPFLFLPQTGSSKVENNRQISLLKKLGCEERIYNSSKGSLYKQITKPIDWNLINLNKETFKRESIKFLLDNIQY